MGCRSSAIYALLAAAYSLIYGLVGRINFAFGELAAAGGYARGDSALALWIGLPPASAADRRFALAVAVALRLGRRLGALGLRAAAQRAAASRPWSRRSASRFSCRSCCA